MKLEFKYFIVKNKNLIIIFSCIIAVLLSMYFFSSMDFFKTNDFSRNFIRGIVKFVYNTNSPQKIDSIVNKANHTVRKLAHIFLFMILTMFVSIFIRSIYKKINIKYSVIALIICFSCGAIDEIHQKFVFGRSSKFSDVLIDTLGGLIGIAIIMYIDEKDKKKIKRLNS